MTRRKMERARKLWNANRRVLRGWQPMRWNQLVCNGESYASGAYDEWSLGYLVCGVLRQLS
jgi:hypothetical protein